MIGSRRLENKEKDIGGSVLLPLLFSGQKE